MANNNNLTTGRTQLNSQLVANAAQLAGPAAQLATGASAMQVASGALKDAFMDKLLGPAAAFTGVLTGSLLVMRKLVRESQILEKGLVKISQLQQIEGKFETLLKSATLAKQRIKELYEFTKNSPFKFTDVAEANRQLEALTYGAFSGRKAMQMVGDAAAATGQSMSEMSERVGKLYSALSSGRSIDKIAFQLQFTGLATEGLLGKLEALEAAGASFNEMWSEVEKVMSRTAGGMENEMQTLESLGVKLEEARSNMQKAFAEPFVEAQSNAIRTMTRATENLTPVLAQVGADIAVVKGAFVDFKTSILDVTLASPGMANALNVAWTAAKALWVALAAITVAKFITGASAMLAFARASWAAAGASMAAARASAAASAAAAALTAAKSAAAAGNLRLAASELYVTARFWATTAAMYVHSAAMTAVGTTAGITAARNYVLGASLGVVKGAANLAGIALRYFWGQVVGIAAAVGLIGGLVTVAVALAAAFVAIKRGAASAAKEFDQMSNAAAAADAKLKELFATAKNTDDWAKAVSAATEEIAKAEQALDDLQARAAKRGAWDKMLGFLTGENIRLDGAQQEAARRPGMLRAQRVASLKQLPFMGLGSKQSEAYARDLQTAQASGDAALENQLQTADAAARVALLEKEADRLRKIATAAKAARDVMEQFNDSVAKQKADFALSDARDAKGRATARLTALGVDLSSPQLAQKQAAAELLAGNRNDSQRGKEQLAAIEEFAKASAELETAEKAIAAMRRASTSELVKTDQTIADIQAKGDAQTDQDRLRLVALQKQRLEIVEQVKNADQLAAAAQQRENDLKQARDTAATTAAGAAFDPAILAATAGGNEALVEELKLKRQVAQIEEQMAQAFRDNNDERFIALRLSRDQLLADKARSDAEFARDRKTERDANAATIRGDRKGAQAIRDANDLRQLQDQYVNNGMSPEQAKADFEQNILAQAAGKIPSIVTDSKQSVGGGGGVYQAADPMLRAQERIARLNEQVRDEIRELRKDHQD
jgi:trimeric autotransporter adhesin